MSVFGVEVDARPEGWTSVEAFTVVQCLDETGRSQLAMRYSEGLTPWASLGLARAAQLTLEFDITQDWRPTDEPS